MEQDRTRTLSVQRQETQDLNPVEKDQENPEKTETSESIEHKVSRLS